MFQLYNFMKYLIPALIIIILFSCKHKDYSIDLPLTQTPTELNQWGITKYDSLKLRNGPDEKADDITITRIPLGAIVEIIKKDNKIKNFENMNDNWYYLDYKGQEGWMFGAFLEIFNSYEEAEKKSEILIFGGNAENENTKK